jgi:MFS family permease
LEIEKKRIKEKKSEQMRKISNLMIFTLASSIMSFASGLLGPFYVVYLQKIGGSIENVGAAFGLMIVTQSVVSLFVGKYSDALGRKPFLIFSTYLTSVIVFAYTLISTLVELYLLQILLGIVDATHATVSTAFLGDITKRSKRGLQVGKYNAIVGIFAGFSMMLSGMLIPEFGFQIIFYAVSLFYLFAASLLFLIKEKRK